MVIYKRSPVCVNSGILQVWIYPQNVNLYWVGIVVL